MTRSRHNRTPMATTFIAQFMRWFTSMCPGLHSGICPGLATIHMIILVSASLSLSTAQAARTVETEAFSLTPELSEQTIDEDGPSGTLGTPPQPTEAQVSLRISQDISLLPEAVRDRRAALIAAAKSGDPNQLRAIISTQPQPPIVSYGVTEDVVDHLITLSGDAEGREILAILLEVLEAGYAHEGAGSDQEIFIWPYFARVSLTELTPVQFVDLFTLVTAGDFEDMRAFGAYNFFRLGISKDGTWQYFIAGD